MKCEACKFDDEEKQVKESWEPELSFIEIEGHFTVVDGEGNHTNHVEVSIYACPKCGTLKIDTGGTHSK